MKYSVAQSPKKPPEKSPEKPSATKPLPKKPHAETYEDIVSRALADDKPEQAPKPKPETKPEPKLEPAPKRKRTRVFAGWLRGASGTGDRIFFFVDSEDPTSPDYSPPGEAFDEAMEDDRRVFATATGTADGGPYKDRWGVWISAMVPVSQPDTEGTLAVLGMDFNATSWKLDMANGAAMPALPAAIAFLFGFYFIISAPRTAWN